MVTLNPDCELYLAYTVACGSSEKQASLLPVKLTNAYLLILSSLMKEANVYMPSAGFVNAMSIVNKTFLQGDFILSQGQMTFYAKESFMLSQIETQIKDTSFGSPSTLGVNSSVIYQITNYNPQPKKQLPTIGQMQDQDYEIMRLMNSHLAYLNGQQAGSPLNALQGDLNKIGVNLMHPNKNSVDIVSAIRNQINSHDLSALTPAERTQFLRTDEGQILLQNVGDVQVISQQLSQVADAQNDVDGEYGGILGKQRLENISRTAEREVKAREAAIKDRTPLLYFQPSEPLGEQIPPVRGLEDININEIPPQAFRAAVPYRFSSYLDYKEDAMRRLKNPKSFLEYQQFQFGNVIQSKTRVKDIDPDFLADIRRMEGPEGEKFYELAIENMNPDMLKEAQRNPFLSAYEQKPSYSRGIPGTDQYEREVEAFRDEVLQGTADLTPLQRDILGDQARPLQESVGSSRQLTIDNFRRAYPTNKDLIQNRIVFRSEEERDDAESKIAEFNSRSGAISPGKGRPSKSTLAQRRNIEREKQAYIDTLTKGQFVTSDADTYRARTQVQRDLEAGLTKSLGRDEERRRENVATGGDEGLGDGPGPSARGRRPEADVQARREIYRKLAEARDMAMIREAEEEKPKSITLPARSNVPGEKPLVVPLSNTTEETYLYRASRRPDAGYYDSDDSDGDGDYEDYRNPTDVGLVGTKRKVQNTVFGGDSIFAAGTPEGAQRFIYESDRNFKGTWDIFKLDVTNKDIVSFPEIGKRMSSEITQRYRLAPGIKTMSNKLQEAYKKQADRYAESVANPAGNAEHIIRGPLNKNRVSLHSTQIHREKPVNNPVYQKVREGMDAWRKLQREAKNMEEEERADKNESGTNI